MGVSKWERRHLPLFAREKPQTLVFPEVLVTEAHKPRMMDAAAPQATQRIMGNGSGINQQMWLKSFGTTLQPNFLTSLI